MTRSALVALCSSLALVPCVANAVTPNSDAKRSTSPVRARRLTEPPEFTGKPVDPDPEPSPTLRRMAESNALQRANPEDRSTLGPALEELSSLIRSDPSNSDLYFMRASLACYVGGKQTTILDDVSKSLSSSSPENRRARFVLRAKIEFDGGSYDQAMRDIDAAIAEDYETAQQIFNDGRTKPSTTARACVWTQPDIATLALRYPKDYRPPLYRGLYLTQFMSFDLASDYNSVLEAFGRAAELNPASPLPHFYIGELYTVGRLGGLLSIANAKCLDYVVPRTEACLALDEARRTGIRALTRAIATDPTFTPAYALRANAFYDVKQYRQAIRDYDKALQATQKREAARTLHNDRALARLALGNYRAAIADFDQAIAIGCDSMCNSYEHRADAYLKLHDYSNAIADISRSIHKVLMSAIFLMNIEEFRRIYPEYDGVADDQLAEKLRHLFFPSFSREQFVNEFIVKEKHFASTVLPDLYIRRGDAYAALGQVQSANHEYDRVSRAFPEWASVSFTVVNGRRVRNSD